MSLSGSTDFPQVRNDRFRLRYGLLTLAEPDFSEIAGQAAKLRSPVLTWPVTTGGRGPAEGCNLPVIHRDS